MLYVNTPLLLIHVYTTVYPPSSRHYIQHDQDQRAWFCSFVYLFVLNSMAVNTCFVTGVHSAAALYSKNNQKNNP